MKACCALLIAVLLALPAARAEDAGPAVSAPAGAQPAASAAAAPPPQQTAVSAPAAAPALAKPELAAPGQPGTAASAPSRAARKKSPSRARAHEGTAPARKRKTDAGAAQPALTDMDPDRNPVIEAINLVANTQRDEIRAADRRVANADWWLDALDREWIVKRPFGPGLFDSTHWFYVSYKVNGRLLMSWFVDLNKGTVSPITPPDTQNGQH